jgi:hypothetical protein
MGFFGAVFVSLTLKLQLGWTGIALGLPFLIFGLILLAAVAVIGGIVAGFAAGLALWAASGLAVRRDGRTKAG